MDFAPEEDFGGNLERQLKKVFVVDKGVRAFVRKLRRHQEMVFGMDIDYACGEFPIVASKGRYREFGDYRCYKPLPRFQYAASRLGAFKMVKSLTITPCTLEHHTYLNVLISPEYMAKSIENMLVNGIDTWAPTLPVKRAVVDFYSPNIAKEIHVGHLRSTIIGDTLARLLEYSKVEVLRRNHVSNWGIQLGMLIEYLFEEFPGSASAAVTTVEHLQLFYKKSKEKLDKDPDFKEKAQLAVVRLQGGDPEYIKVWAKICEISRTESTEITKRLQVELEEMGESFYKPYISNMIEELTIKGLVEEIDGARVISTKDLKTPLMLVKRDGGFTYIATELAALWYRLNQEKAEWIIYVTDAGKHEHFDKLFKVARKAGWLPANDIAYPRASHAGVGVVLAQDGKRFRSRNIETFRLVHLLDVAKTCSKIAIIKRAKEAKEWTPDELDQTAEAVGYSAVKFADLKNNRLTSYTFNYEQMLCDKGKTAVYLHYAHARICSIIRKSGKDIDELEKAGKLELHHADERALGLHLLQFSETVEEACTKLLPHVLCEYLYGLSKKVSKFYTNCQVNGSAEETSRLLLCKATAIVMRKCFDLLGITPVYKL